MTDNVLPQILQTLRSSALQLPNQLELALQAAAWSELSRREQLPPKMRISPAKIADEDGLRTALDTIAARGELFDQAFTNTSAADLGSPEIRGMFELAYKLSCDGILNKVDWTDAITALPPNRFGDWSLPPQVASLMVQLATLQKNESAYTPWDVGAQLAIRAKTECKSVFLESPVRSAIPALISLLTSEPIEIRFSDPIDTPSFVSDGALRKFDAAISFPPMGQRHSQTAVERDWFKRFKERTASGSVLGIRHLLAQTDRRIVVAVPNNITFSPGAERALREDLLARGIIRSVIAMPTGLLDSTMIAFTLLVLEPRGGRDAVHFVNAAEGIFARSGSRGRTELAEVKELIAMVELQSESDYSLLVPVDEILKNDAQLQVSRYVLPASVRELQAKLEGAQTVSLGDIVATARPMSVSKDQGAIEVGEIGAGDIPAYGYIGSPGRTVRVSDLPKDRKNFLRPLDLVLIVKGSVGKVGIVPKSVPAPGPGGWVAGQSAIVLRANDRRVDPRALALQLRSDFGQQMLRRIVSGASIPLIQVRELMRLEVLVPDDEARAKAIVALQREEELKQQIDELEAQLSQVAAGLWRFA